MHRCFELAKLGMGNVAPNPIVGAVLVHNDRIIGEGYHRQYGQAHAEVNCINSVAQTDQQLIASSTMYVSLEPCAHFGKTPPCADLIIKYKIPVVVIGCRDSFKEVAGKGIQKMEAAGIQVITGVLKQAALELNNRFFTFHNMHRPYIILKWAQTSDHKIAGAGDARLLISNEKTNRLVHKWRSEEAAILVGTNTALKDNPSLTIRLWQGNNPVRLVIDKELKLPKSMHLFDGSVKTIVFNTIKHEEGEIFYYKLADKENFIPEILAALYQLNIQSVLIEGGSALLQSFIEGGYWDEARVITNYSLQIGIGTDAPKLLEHTEVSSEKIMGDLIQYFKPMHNDRN